MKSTHRFNYTRFAETLAARGMIDRETLNHVLQQCNATGALLTEILVRENLVSDWEVSRVACELYHLPFLTVESYPPAPSVLDGLDPDYLRQYAVVPMDRFGNLMTVVMPGLVPTEILDGLLFGEGSRILPVVGSVVSNRNWLDQHLPPPDIPGLDGLDSALPSDISAETSWAGIFDAGEEAVQLELRDKPDSE